MFFYSIQERKNRDAQMRATINQKLVVSGERDKYDYVFVIRKLILLRCY